jgi:SPP1 gp7 family putative phage head morphogenesis protein
MVTKKLTKDVSGVVVDLVKQGFKRLKQRYRLNLKTIFNKSFDRASLVGTDLGTKSAAKANIRQKIAAVQRMMTNDIDKIGNEQSQNVARVVAQAYAMGIPSLKLKQQVKNEIDKADFKVDRAVRTGTAYLSSVTKLLAWQDQGFKNYAWLTGRNDSKTRPLHRKLNGKVYKIKDALEGRWPAQIPGRVIDRSGNVVLGESINCRCSVRVVS